MPSPPIQVFLTTIASQPALRQRQELLLRTLQVKKIPFASYDLASDEEAKKLWRRKAPADKQQLPGILVGGKFPGTFSEFEDAIEYHELNIFLRLDEEYDAAVEEDRPAPSVKPVGVPGALTPAQSTPLGHRVITPSPSPSPLKGKGSPRVVNKEEQIDVGEELSGYGLQGVKVTTDDLRALMEELGLEGEEAEDMVKGLSGDSGKKADEKKVVEKVDEKKDDEKVDEKKDDKKVDESKPEAEDKKPEAEGTSENAGAKVDESKDENTKEPEAKKVEAEVVAP